MSSPISKLRRVQELFDAGKHLWVNDPSGEPIHFWVVKPTTFIRDEAIKDARSARARALLAWDANDDEKASALSDVTDLSHEEKAEILARGEESEHIRLAADEIKTEPEWAERLEALRSADLDGATEDELEAVSAATQEFNLELVKRAQERYDEEYAALVSEDDEALTKKLMQRQRDRAGAAAFAEARRVTELWRCLRDCSPVEKDGTLDHSPCGGHRVQLVEKRSGIRTDLPDEIIARASDALAEMQMSEAEAGNSAAPSVSSGPWEPRSTPEGSTPSTPTEM